MSDLRKNLIALMALRGWNAYALEEKSGVPQPTTYRFLKGIQNEPKEDTVKKWAEAFGINESQMRGFSPISELLQQENYTFNPVVPKLGISVLSAITENNNDYNHYPRVVGTARCGDHGYYMDLEGGDGYIELNLVPGTIAIRIKGHSMHPAIREGWYVVIEPNKQPNVGEYVLAKFKDGKKMVKELLQIKADGYLLLSVNGDERITANFEDLEEIQAVTAIVSPSKHKDWLD